MSKILNQRPDLVFAEGSLNAERWIGGFQTLFRKIKFRNLDKNFIVRFSIKKEVCAAILRHLRLVWAGILNKIVRNIENMGIFFQNSKIFTFFRIKSEIYHWEIIASNPERNKPQTLPLSTSILNRTKVETIFEMKFLKKNSKFRKDKISGDISEKGWKAVLKYFEGFLFNPFYPIWNH